MDDKVADFLDHLLLGCYLETPKVWQLIPEVLTVEEVDMLLSQPQGTHFTAVRDRAILELLYATGMRVSEGYQYNRSIHPRQQ